MLITAESIKRRMPPDYPTGRVFGRSIFVSQLEAMQIHRFQLQTGVTGLQT
jgi:hypothetical protein